MKNEVIMDRKAIEKAEKKICLAINQMKIPDVLSVIGSVLVDIAVSVAIDTMDEKVCFMFDDYLDNMKNTIRESIEDTLDNVDDDKILN